MAQEVGSQVRLIIEHLVDTRAPDADLGEIRDQLTVIADRLSSFEHGRTYEGYSEASTAGGGGIEDGQPSGHTDFSPVIGTANPLAPPLVMSYDEATNTVIGDVVFGSAYEGAPGCAHGGWVAAAFDEVMGAAQALSGNPGMTGTLTTIYRSPTPIRTQLRITARLERVEGRKIFVVAEMHAGEVLCAEATAVFISIDFAKVAAMMAQRNAD
ncbi:MAG: PaaI family thioesterase [Acidimicrobiales bacterium]